MGEFGGGFFSICSALSSLGHRTKALPPPLLLSSLLDSLVPSGAFFSAGPVQLQNHQFIIQLSNLFSSTGSVQHDRLSNSVHGPFSSVVHRIIASLAMSRATGHAHLILQWLSLTPLTTSHWLLQSAGSICTTTVS